MRFARVDLLRYGCFTERTLELAARAPDLHLLVGENEAGKTTLRAALSDLLFGFEHRTRYAFRHEPSALRVGALLERDGVRLDVRRRKGNKATLLDAEERPLGEASLVGLLGGADRPLFERMFSLDQAALVSGGKELLSAQDRVGQMLFQASAGLSGLGDVREALNQEADGLWGDRRRADRSYSVAQDELEAAEETLRKVKVRAHAWKQAEAERERTERELEAAVAEHAKRVAAAARLARIGRVAPALERRRGLLERAQGLVGDVLLPRGARAEFEELLRIDALADAQIKERSRERREVEERLDALRVDERVLARAEDIKACAASLRLRVADATVGIEKRRAEVKLLSAQARALAARLGWPEEPLDALRARLAPDLAHGRVATLIRTHGRLEAELVAANNAVAHKEREREELAAQCFSLGDEEPSPRLRDALEAGRRLGDVEERRLPLAAASARGAAKLGDALAHLAPFSGDVAALRRLALPAAEVVDALCARAAELDNMRQKVEAEQDAGLATRDRLRLRERQIRRDARPVTRDELVAARGERDARWRALRLELIGVERTLPPSVVASEAQGFEAALGAADELADRRFDAAEASAELQTVSAGLEEAELGLGESGRRLAQIAVQTRELAGELERARGGLGVASESPRALRAWLACAREALAEAERAEAAQGELDALDRAATQVSEALADALLADGAAPLAVEGRPLSGLLSEAAARVKEREQGRTRRVTMEAGLATLDRALPELRRRLADAKDALVAWRTEWADALRGIALPAETDPELAEQALGTLRQLGAKLEEIRAIEHDRIATMQRDLDAFSDEAARLAGAVAGDLAGTDAGEVALELERRLEAAIRARRDRETATTELERLDAVLRAARDRKAEALAALRPLFEAAQVADVAALAAAVERSEERRRLLDAVLDEEGRLTEIGEGLSLAALEDEASGEDLATLQGRLAAALREVDELAKRREELAVRHADARRACEAIAGQDAAAVAASRRAEALAGMSGAIERYLRLRTAHRLLGWAMERFRRERQGPLLARAGEIFAALTLGELERLVVELDEKDQPELLGVRRGGERVPVGAMSMGTTDQLYLALRIAALEHHLEAASPLPFVADDLFVHFDDRRAAAGFQVLAGLARRTQVLFFTHHEHLVDVARRAIGEAAFTVTRL